MLYPTAFVVLSALVYGGFIHEPDPDVTTLLSGADILAQAGAFDESEAQVRDVLEREPENLHAHLILGFIAERREDHGGAIAIYRQCLGLTDESALQTDIRLSIADLERRRGDYDAARAELAALERDRGPSARVWRSRGFVSWDENDLEAATTNFRRFSELDPGNAEAPALVASTMIRGGHGGEAREVLEGIDAEESAAWPVWMDLARSALEAGDPQQARADLGCFIELDPQARKRLGKDEFWRDVPLDETFPGLFR